MEVFSTSLPNLDIKYNPLEKIKDVLCSDVGCRRIIFQIQGNEILIQCKRCKKIHRIVFDKTSDSFRIVE